ncbi:Oxidoreductase NAD-binding domain-containing protein 1 [Amphibalanus amphitrite]|uniref:Oxidoreductase NAD-binding domain-containing protein 1 n=1 Tax=Amphibalanus amphitrite TaxID=1232801 RepID=A0A6A4WK80_AMPAM|nr:Oxidoreductase NAD-binding domain-containing protein 1 [Amphibalanus amphitrite]
MRLGSKVRRMSSSRKEHLDVTAGQFRHDLVSGAEVVDKRLISPTVYGLTLKVEDPNFGFHAGQWQVALVDFCIPGTNLVGGYSMCSAPDQLRTEGTLELAVKRSSWPPAVWIHQQCRVGSRVTLKAGGDFFFHPAPQDPARPLLLVAGGVGINPLVSILRHCRHLRAESRRTGAGYVPRPVELLYSARSRHELIFRDTIAKMADEGLVTANLFVTGNDVPANDTSCHNRRVSSWDVESAVARLGGAPLCYLCGPSAMVEAVEGCLLGRLRLNAADVRFERWW